jgi:hypothetical protein
VERDIVVIDTDASQQPKRLYLSEFFLTVRLRAKSPLDQAHSQARAELRLRYHTEFAKRSYLY